MSAISTTLYLPIEARRLTSLFDFFRSEKNKKAT